jgi:hypothetical protein
MTLGAAQTTASGSSLLTYLLGGALLIGLGYARAQWVRARSDYKATKAAVKVLRKGWLAALWTFVKLAVLAGIALIVVASWFIYSVRHDQTAAPTSATPSPTQTR